MDNKNERDNQRNNTILLTVIGVATLLVALVGATFAYFSATITNNSNQSVNITTATPVSLIYTGAELKLENVLPGNSNTNTFTVQNPSTSPSDQTYDLTFYIDSNNFETSTGDNLTLEITGTGTTNTPVMAGDFASGAKDYTDGATYGANYSSPVVSDQRIAIGETQTYTAVLTFSDTGSLDNTNQTKTFTSHIDIEDAKTVNTAQSESQSS